MVDITVFGFQVAYIRMAATVIIAVVVRLCFALSVGFPVSENCIRGPGKDQRCQCSDRVCFSSSILAIEFWKFANHTHPKIEL